MRDRRNAPQRMFVFFDRYILLLIAISTFFDLAITVYFLSQGTTIVFPNIYYLTIVLASYRYRWKGALFSAALSAAYLGLSALYDPHIDPILQAIIRSFIFILIATIVAFLSTRLGNEKKRYHTIFSKAESGMVVVLMDTYGIKEANQRFWGIVGVPKVDGSSLEIFFHRNDIEILKEYHRKAQDFSDLDMIMTSRTGEERRCLVSGSSLSPQELVISLLDVTDRMKMELAVRESEMKFRGIFDHSNDALYLYELDKDQRPGVLSSVNEESCRMLGYSHEELMGLTFDDLMARVQVPGMEGTAGQRGTKVGKFEELHKRQDGSVIPVEIYEDRIDIAGHPMVLAVVRDISDRKRAEEERRLNEETMRTVVSSAPFPLMITNWDGSYILDANSQAMAAFGLEIGVGQQLADIFVEEAELEKVMNILACKGSVDGMEVSLHSKDGERQWHMLSARTITYPGEDRLLLTTYDITERRRMEKALHEANQKLGIMNSITRHDILNQMTVLNGFIELAKLKEKDPQLVTYFEKMSRASGNVQMQIAFTKDYQDMGVKAPIWVPIGQKSSEAFTMLHPTGVTLEEATEGVEILADQLAEKVPYNLIDNSMRHGEHVTHIKMSAEPVGDAMLIVYQDDGLGINDKTKERLFEKGFGKNTGLGLFLAREILAITGITIRENGQEGKGVRFEILVPEGAWRRSST